MCFKQTLMLMNSLTTCKPWPIESYALLRGSMSHWVPHFIPLFHQQCSPGCPWLAFLLCREVQVIKLTLGEENLLLTMRIVINMWDKSTSLATLQPLQRLMQNQLFFAAICWLFKSNSVAFPCMELRYFVLRSNVLWQFFCTVQYFQNTPVLRMVSACWITWF